MRIIRFIDGEGNEHIGQRQEDGSALLIEGDLFGAWSVTPESRSVQRLLAPIKPANIFCIGLNYREHADESGHPHPQSPIVFMKPNSALANPGDTIYIPRCCDPDGEVDYECELAVVIGKLARDVSEEAALDHVLGYTAANDVSARKWQANGGGGQWIRGKGFDTFCPLGPVLVTADEIQDPQSLEIRTVINGETLQQHTTADMIFSVRQLIHFLSQDTSLHPGTVILTGTPQGVGAARKPPRWLQPGDEVIVELENVGSLANTVAAAS